MQHFLQREGAGRARHLTLANRVRLPAPTLQVRQLDRSLKLRGRSLLLGILFIVTLWLGGDSVLGGNVFGIVPVFYSLQVLLLELSVAVHRETRQEKLKLIVNDLLPLDDKARVLLLGRKVHFVHAHLFHLLHLLQMPLVYLVE